MISFSMKYQPIPWTNRLQRRAKKLNAQYCYQGDKMQQSYEEPVIKAEENE